MSDTSLASVLPWRAFAAESEIDLRSGGVLIGYHLHGPSPEMSDLQSLAANVRQLAAAFVHLGSRDCVHVLWHRQKAESTDRPKYRYRAAELVETERQEQNRDGNWTTLGQLFLSHRYSGAVKGWIQTALLSRQGTQETRADLLREYALKRFTAFEDAASSSVALSKMGSLELFRALLRSVTYHGYPALLPGPENRLNHIIGAERFVGGTAPWINGYHLRPVCLTAYPAATVPQILAVLLRHPGEMTLCARMECLDPYDVKKQLETERHHWNREVLGTLTTALKKWFARGAPARVDEDGSKQLADIDSAIAAASGGISFGRVTVTAIVRDQDQARADMRAHALLQECHSMGIMARIEDMNAVEAIMGTWPGMVDENIRRPLMTGANFADLVLPATHWTGSPPSPLVVGGRGDMSPFYFPTHVGGVANQLIIGPSGSGKSSLLGALVCAYLGVPDARIAWLDLDYSSFVLAHLLGAQYHDLGAQDSPPLCPLAVLDQANGVDWLSRWFERLFKRWDYEMDERSFEDFVDALRKARREGVRDLLHLRAMLAGGGGRDRMRRILMHMIEYWPHIYGGKSDHATLADVTVYELRNLTALGKRASAPATELILHNIIEGLRGQPAWILADEFWSLLGDDISSDWLFDAIRTLRKKNAGFVGCTQSLVEIVNSPFRDLMLESMPGKIFLANHEAANSYVAASYRALGLSPHEISCIAGARPRSDYYYRCSQGSRLFQLQLGPMGQAICASTGYQDVQRAREILAESPGELFLDGWLGGQQSLPVIAAA